MSHQKKVKQNKSFRSFLQKELKNQYLRLNLPRHSFHLSEVDLALLIPISRFLYVQLYLTHQSDLLTDFATDIFRLLLIIGPDHLSKLIK